MSAARELVFVDLDRCLLLDDSISAFLARLIDLGLVPASTLWRGALAYVAYRLNLADPETMIHKGMRHMQGLSESRVEAEAKIFFRDHARFRYRRALLDELDQHKAAKRPIYLLTGGLPYLPRLIAADLGFAGAMATIAETNNGVYSGRSLEPPCVGAGKIVHAQRVAEATDLTLAGCWFYSDSFSDLPMLRVATHPVAVNPDYKLKRWAKRYGWRILAGG